MPMKFHKTVDWRNHRL